MDVARHGMSNGLTYGRLEMAAPVLIWLERR